MKHLYTVRMLVLLRYSLISITILWFCIFCFLNGCQMLTFCPMLILNASHLPLKSPLFYSGKITILTILTIE